MKDIIKEKLSENNELDKILSLNILYLKHKMVLETEDYSSLYVLKYFCYDHCFSEELKKINEHFKIEISVENPFKPIVLDELKNEYLIEFSTYANNKGGVCISNEGINYLKKYYKINDEGLSFTNMIVYNTINIININISNMKKQYVYIGQYYHIKNKELPLDFKFGVTDNLDQREYSLGRTKSPIKYMILKAWEIPINVSRERVEKLIATIFSEYKYDGCEWYDIDGDIFQNKISSLFQIITEMVQDVNFNFVEVNLNTDDIDTKVEGEIEKEIRTGKKSPWTSLKIKIDNNDILGNSGKECFINAFKKILEKIDPITLSIDFNKIFKEYKEDYVEYKQNQCSKIGDFYLDCQSSTKEKQKQLKEVFVKYNIDGDVDVV